MKILVSRTAIALAIPVKEWIELPERADLAHLIEVLAERYSSSLRQELVEGGELAKELLVLINGTSAYKMDGIKTILEDGDKVYFMVMTCDG